MVPRVSTHLPLIDLMKEHTAVFRSSGWEH